MSQQYTPNLGSIITDSNARRDCIHIAVAPVVAAHSLPPGLQVGLTEKGEAANLGTEKAIGIVDPFLTKWVEKGETFWLVLYPNTITSLRHVWQHPSFQIKIPERKTNEG